MKREKWEQIKDIFDAALQRAPVERERFLAENCSGDEELRREVRSLLSSFDGANSFLQKPAVGEIADIIESGNKKLEGGKHFGYYRIIEQIGAGGMGEVYLADDTKLDRRVAIKFLNEEFSQDADKLRRFIQEAKAASALNHPNILTVYEIGESEGKNYIATEYIEGKTLREHLTANEAMSLHQILKIGVQTAEALTAAHQAGIIHRDIKPENIMLREDGYAKVLDFGLAKLTEKKKSEKVSLEGETKAFVQTNPGVVMGTVSYMSPEQARGKETDARTDIWSLGVVLYEILAGKLPFTGETINHTIVAILEKEPLLLENVPDELQRIVRKALTKEKEMRYQTARDLLIDLKNLRRTLDIQGELERSVIPNREATTDIAAENATQIYSEKSIEETKSEAAKTTQNITNSSSLEYAVTQVKSHKFVTAAAGIILLSIVSAIAYFSFFAKSATKQIESIAVMPFVNESGDADVEYLSDGMTETLINSLSQIANLNVKARSTVFYYKGKEISPQKIGEELKVQAVLLGRVVQRGNDLKLSLELVNTQTQDVIWSETYNRKQSDLVSLQSEVARDVLSKLKIRLTGADEQKLAKKSTKNAEAYQLYIQGRYEWNKFSFDSLKKSIPLFERAIQIDPTFALAYSGLADSYVNLGVDYTSAHDTMPQARVAAIQAIALDDSLAEAHTSLASYKLFYEWDITGAEEEYRKAISLDAKYGNARHFYSHCLQFSGREAEAIREMKTAVELEPLSLVNNSELGWAYYLANQHDAAIEQLHKTIKLDPSFSAGYFTLGLVYADKGNYAEAVAALREGQRLSPDWLELQAVLAYTYASAGERGEAEALLTKLLKSAADTYVNPVLIAGVYVALTDNDRAIAWLERGYREKCSWMRWIAIEPQLKRLRPDPRFQDLVSRVNR
ncbi:MAG: protein kinase [Acidobacteria bacterium]|nr:protein kinase [Acidobacteriota bacterium]MCA1636939.1 protein kinase [Acidobacteriota bacterium]